MYCPGKQKNNQLNAKFYQKYAILEFWGPKLQILCVLGLFFSKWTFFMHLVMFIMGIGGSWAHLHVILWQKLSKNPNFLDLPPPPNHKNWVNHPKDLANQSNILQVFLYSPPTTFWKVSKKSEEVLHFWYALLLVSTIPRLPSRKW